MLCHRFDLAEWVASLSMRLSNEVPLSHASPHFYSYFSVTEVTTRKSLEVNGKTFQNMHVCDMKLWFELHEILAVISISCFDHVQVCPVPSTGVCKRNVHAIECKTCAPRTWQQYFDSWQNSCEGFLIFQASLATSWNQLNEPPAVDRSLMKSRGLRARPASSIMLPCKQNA